DYVVSNVVDPLSRLDGVGSTQVFGSQHAMRIWINPDLLDTYKLSVDEMIAAIKAQNQQVSIGQLGGAPAVPGQEINFTINTRGRLSSSEEFEEIVLRSSTDGSVLKLKDVARVELGAERYGLNTFHNGRVATGVAISLSSGANALETAEN